MGQRQNGPLGTYELQFDPKFAPNFQRDGLPLRLVLPGPLGTPDWNLAAGHNRSQAKKPHNPPTGDPDLELFKKNLIKKQVDAREKQGKKAILGLSGDELGPLKEAKPFEMRKDVAVEFDKMWKHAKEDFANREGGDRSDSIGVASTYRSAKDDAVAWEKAFKNYYRDTYDMRTENGDSEFSDAALEKIFHFMNGKKAPPGFSGHTHGIAADLVTRDKGKTWSVDSHKANQRGWQTTWLYDWLVTNAGTYHFYQLKTETWHWEYHADGNAKKFNCWEGNASLKARKV